MSGFIGGGHNDFTPIDDSKLIPLGTLAAEPDKSLGGTGNTPAQDDQGPRVYRYVKNEEGATAFAEGDVIAYKLGESKYLCVIAPASCRPARVVGVAWQAQAAGKYGWIICHGKAKVRAGAAGITADRPLIVGVAAGVAIDAATPATDSSFAWSHEAAAAGALAGCHIQCLNR